MGWNHQLYRYVWVFKGFPTRSGNVVFLLKHGEANITKTKKEIAMNMSILFVQMVGDNEAVSRMIP